MQDLSKANLRTFCAMLNRALRIFSQLLKPGSTKKTRLIERRWLRQATCYMIMRDLVAPGVVQLYCAVTVLAWQESQLARKSLSSSLSGSFLVGALGNSASLFCIACSHSFIPIVSVLSHTVCGNFMPSLCHVYAKNLHEPFYLVIEYEVIFFSFKCLSL